MNPPDCSASGLNPRHFVKTTAVIVVHNWRVYPGDRPFMPYIIWYEHEGCTVNRTFLAWIQIQKAISIITASTVRSIHGILWHYVTVLNYNYLYISFFCPTERYTCCYGISASVMSMQVSTSGWVLSPAMLRRPPSLSWGHTVTK